jgi:multisubunit Na+/H+ antiporter MnhB subunit
MTDFRYGLAGLVLFFAVLVAVTNWRRLLRARDPDGGRAGGTVPFVSIGLTALAASIHPGPDKMWMLWFPLADVATWLVVILPFWLMVKAFFPGKREGKIVGQKQ